MDSYPPAFVLHLQPTLIVTGLTPADTTAHQDASTTESTSGDNPPPPPPRPVDQDQQGQTQVNSSLESQKAMFLEAMLSRNNVSYWDNTKGLAGSLYYVVSQPRSYILPPTRKFLQQTGQQLSNQPSFSPTSPSSPLYPDGLVTPLWIKRHREKITSVFIAVVDLWDRESLNGTDDNGQRTFSDKGPLGIVDPMERERDTALAQELLERRKAAQERYVKFAAVILLRPSHMEDPSIEDRLNFVRKSAGLDNKNSFYILPPSNSQEISDFAVNLQRSQYEGSMNYYKEQIKRHKKKKSSLPAGGRPNQQQPSTGTQQQHQQQQGLSTQGWMLRYEFKMGVFSECKQDIDNAVKHYESAYGLLIDMFAVTSAITPGASGFQSHTKRWAEAKVLADCLCFKICKFHLYTDAPSTALFCFRRHLLVFKAFSESWKMGDDSFEYWAWLAKQYRMIGDLIDVGTKSGLKLPAPTPGSVVYGSFAGLLEGSKDLNKLAGIAYGNTTVGFGIGPGGEASVFTGSVGGGRGGGTHGPGAGINPMLVLQHAGYFYHQAANCTVQRRLRFELAEQAYPDSSVAPAPSTSRPYPPSLQSMNAERNIDHHTHTIELLTKSYEQFKRYKSGRMTLFLASEIAGTYYAAGKFEMALKFFERIGKTYRKENWTLILTSILKWSVQCAKELGYWETVVECLIEMMSPDMPSTTEKRQSSFSELIDILYNDNHLANTVVHKPLVLSMPQINSFVNCVVQFQKPQASVSSESRFQLQISTRGGEEALPKPLRISFIQVEFSDSTLNHRFEDPRPYTNEEESHPADGVLRTTDRTGRTLEWIDCSQCSLENLGTDTDKPQSVWKKDLNLDIRPFETKVIEGVIVPATEQVVKVLKITLGVVSNHWNVALEFPSQDIAQEQEQTQQHHMPPEGEPPKRQWLEAQDSTEGSPKLRFKYLDRGSRRTTELCIVPRESKVEINTLFKSPAYLDEFFAIKIKVRNGETRPVSMEMDVDLQPIDPSIESQDSIVLDPHAEADATPGTTQSLRGIRLVRSSKGSENDEEGIPVGQWAEQVVYVKALGIPSSRTVVCKVRYQISLDKDQTSTWTEKQHSFRTLFILPFDAQVDYILQPTAPALTRNGHDSRDATNGIPAILEPNQTDDRHGTVVIPALMQKEDYLMSTRVNNEGPWPVEVQEVKLITNTACETPNQQTSLSRQTSFSGGLSRSQSLRRSGERKALQEAGIHVELIESGDFNGETKGDDRATCVQQWKPGNLQSFSHLVRVVAMDQELAPEQIDIGLLRIRWRRYEENEAKKVPFTTTDVPLKPLTWPKAEVYMTVDLPKFAQVNRPFTARYQVHNPTGKLHELSMMVEQSEGMVFAGAMQTTIRLLPYASYPIQLSCYPIHAGLIKLPRVKLVINKRKVTRRNNVAGSQLLTQEEVLVKMKGSAGAAAAAAAAAAGAGWSTSTVAGSEAVAIFVKPETGQVE
ncbi:hypothetical protein BGX31_003438 [Mortierella sp. GBA43]|nr:hypothetical protein BGX31_003427 [Mortierella sp. GBA43]KAG0246962.1 hypothetical protein BGX31_003438 [Mortierella sp. GBA43]